MGQPYDDDDVDDYWQEQNEDAALFGNEYVWGNCDGSDGIEVDGLDGDDY